jgi:hypothetical protein
MLRRCASLPTSDAAMSTTRDRFGVSILVGLVLAVLCSLTTPALAARQTGGPLSAQTVGDEGIGGIERIMTAASSRAQVAVGLGAGVPLLIVGFMVRRRIYAEV